MSTVKDIMSTSLTIVEPESTLGKAATLMGERAIGSVLVVEDGRLTGILTERDVVRALSTTHDAPTSVVAEWMTKGPTTTGRETPVKEALRAMMDGGFRHLPVLDGDSIVGIVSIRDVAGALAD